MNQNDFTMRARFRHLLRPVFGTLFLGAFAIWILPNILLEIPNAAAAASYGSFVLSRLFIFGMLAGFVMHALEIVETIVSRCEVQGNDIRYASLFRRREFTFDDIEHIQFLKMRFPGSIYVPTLWRIRLREDKCRLTIPHKSINIEPFFERIRSRNIPIQ